VRAIDKRIAALEESKAEKLTYYAWKYGDIPPVIPDDIGDRPVVIVRWAIVEPPVRDSADNIIAPAREWDGDDPRYQELHAAKLDTQNSNKLFDPAFSLHTSTNS